VHTLVLFSLFQTYLKTLKLHAFLQMSVLVLAGIELIFFIKARVGLSALHLC